MAGNTFDRIAQELLKQQHLLQQMLEENRTLKQQLSELRAGHGIVLLIDGQRFAVGADPSQPLQPAVTAPLVATPEAKSAVIADAPTAEMKELQQEEREESTAQAEARPREKTTTFLEEIMIDEFAAASTSPHAVWQGPVEKKKPEVTEEEQKAALRRELLGSYLLE